MDKKSIRDLDDSAHMKITSQLIALEQKLEMPESGAIESVMLKNLNLKPFIFKLTATSLGRLLCSGIPSQPLAIRFKNALESVLGRFKVLLILTDIPGDSRIEILSDSVATALSIIEQDRPIRSLSRVADYPCLSDIEEESDVSNAHIAGSAI